MNRVLAFSLTAATLVAACGGSDDDKKPSSPPTADAGAPAIDPNALSGGLTTVFDATKDAYAQMAPTVKGDRTNDFTLGHAIFDENWVTAPATTEDQDGVGPRFNQRSCSACHSKDGRAAPYDSTHAQLNLLLRLSIPGTDEHNGPLGDPIYGTQLRPVAILGIPADGVPHAAYVEVPGTYGDGTAYSLQKPTYTIDGWGDGAPASGLMISARVGLFAIGLGLLEAIPETAILANVKSGNPDNVVGKPNHVWSPESNSTVLGRFGWKANVATVKQQTAGALQGDMGITSSLNPSETCTPTMTKCLAAPNGGTPEIDDDKLDALVFYMQTLAVPARRNLDDPNAQHGAQLFDQMGCSSCHTTTFQTDPNAKLPEVANQTIHPYTDLLLHDMGADLADNRPDYEASGSEWRTPPLWGIGLLQTVNGHTLLMHDARARNFAEAILWHGGEATAARERFRTAAAADRDALTTFLQSL